VSGYRDFEFSSEFRSVLAAESPSFIAFTDGSLQPSIASENYSIVHKLTVADFNGDYLDDVVLSYGDVNVKPRLYLSNGDGTFRFEDWMPEGSERRLIRNTVVEDLNGDGREDFVGFTAPHGFYEDQLGDNWGMGEPDLILLNEGDGFVMVDSLTASYHHGGAVGDLNGDQLLDVFGISEFPDWHGSFTTRVPLLQTSNGDFASAEWGLDEIFSQAIISDMRLADMNNDGNQDLVVSINVQNKVEGGRVSLPADSLETGVIAYALGQPGGKFSQLSWESLGTHWMTQTDWESFTKIHDPNGSSSNNYQSGPSNIEVVDINDDGLLDILVGFYANAGKSWRTSGFKYFENTGSGFVDRTSAVFPDQTSNRDVEKVTYFTIGFELVDLDYDGDKDLIRTEFGGESYKDAPNDVSSIIFIQEDGVFRPPQKYQLETTLSPFPGLKNLLSGDFNGDGALDLLSTIRTSNSHVLVTHINTLSHTNPSQEARGTNASDQLDLSSGSALLARGGGGDDLLIGRADRIDSAIFGGARNNFRVFRQEGQWKVQDQAGLEGLDTLEQIDRLIFPDKAVALDFNQGDSSYNTVMMIGAAFGKALVLTYFGVGVTLFDQGATTAEIAQTIADLKLIETTIGTEDTTAWINHVYKNLVGVEPDPLSLDLVSNLLETGAYTRASLLAFAAELPLLETQVDITGLQSTGLTYTPFG
jgi:hypothetical protein